MIRNSLAITATLFALATLAQAADKSKPEVLVRVLDGSAVSQQTLLRAQDTATDILAAAGVRLRWTSASRPTATGSVQTIDLRFSDTIPADYLPGALAAAHPFAQSGLRITVFTDRVARLLPPAQTKWSGRVLGHVLAHEIGHMLLGHDSHSTNGLMKALWSEKDFEVMKSQNLPFTPEHASLIRSNADRARSRVAETLIAAADHQ
jgi:hypothetical protein